MRERDSSTGDPGLREDGDLAAASGPGGKAGRFTLTRAINYAEVAVVMAVVLCLLTVALIPDGPLQAGRNWVFDLYQVLYPARRGISSAVVVEIDEESIRRIGPWPWPRDTLAALIDRARGARAIGLDILLPDADRLSPDRLTEELHVSDPALRQSLLRLPAPDAVLATALRTSPSVLAMTGLDESDSATVAPASLTPIRERGDGIRAALPHTAGARWPLAALGGAGHGIGIVSAVRGRAGEIDRLPAAVVVAGSILPGFGLQLLNVAQNADSLVLDAGPGGLSSVSVDGFKIRTDPSGEIRPRFVGPERLSRIPAYRLMEPDAGQIGLRGRIVVIGVTAPGASETFRIPLGVQESSAAIQAEFIDSVMAGDTLWRPPWAVAAEGVAAVLTSLVVAVLLGRIPYRLYVLVFCGIVVLVAGSAIVLFRTQGWLVDCVLPLCCLFTAGFTAINLRIGTEMATRRRREAELALERVRRSAERREAALQSEAETLRQSLTFAIDAARLGVWDADLRTGVWHHSPRHDAILGLDAAPSAWSPAILLDRVVANDLAMVRSHFSAAVESGMLQFECRIAWPDGSIRYVHVFGRFWHDASDAPIRVAGVVADVTPQRELELRLRQGEKMQTVGLLAGGVAHNFNNLLTVVLGSLELAQSRLDASSRASSLLEGAIAASRKCADIARQLLAFARLQPLQPKSVEPASLLRNIVQMLRNALPDRIELRLDAPAELGAIKIDPVEFELALLNLAINARDAMPKGGRLTIVASGKRLQDGRLGLDGTYLVVEVIDNGHGIAADKLPKVFDPFFTTKDVGQGTGLGLSQVHGFAHQSGGSVDIESAPGQGTRVRLYLPLSEKITQPALVVRNGGTAMTARSIFLVLLLLGGVSAHAQEATIGSIKSLDGHATVTHGDLTYAASLGGAVHEGDMLRTYWDGTLGVTFKDNTRISMGPSSRVTIPHFTFAPAEEHYGFVLRLVAGTMQYISGLTAKLSPDSMKIETPTATIGVRGTRFLARAEP